MRFSIAYRVASASAAVRAIPQLDPIRCAEFAEAVRDRTPTRTVEVAILLD